MNDQTMRKLERMLGLHPSLVSCDNKKQIEAWQKRKADAKMLRALKAIPKRLSEFAGSSQNAKVRILLSEAVGLVTDAIFIFEEAKEE
jgi:hypothetical protein